MNDFHQYPTEAESNDAIYQRHLKDKIEKERCLKFTIEVKEQCMSEMNKQTNKNTKKSQMKGQSYHMVQLLHSGIYRFTQKTPCQQ